MEDFNKAFDLKAPGSGKYAVLLEKFDSDVNFNEICFERGLIYFDLDSVELAYNDFSYCITTNYNVEKSMFYRGIILYNSGNKLEAYRDLSRVVAMGTGDSYIVIEAKRILDAHF